MADFTSLWGDIGKAAGATGSFLNPVNDLKTVGQGVATVGQLFNQSTANGTNVGGIAGPSQNPNTGAGYDPNYLNSPGNPNGNNPNAGMPSISNPTPTPSVASYGASMLSLPQAPTLNTDVTPYLNAMDSAMQPYFQNATNAYNNEVGTMQSTIDTTIDPTTGLPKGAIPASYAVAKQNLQNTANTVQTDANSQIQANQAAGQAQADQYNQMDTQQAQQIQNQLDDTKLQLAAFAKTNGSEGGDPFLVAEQAAAGQPYAQALTQLNENTKAQLGQLAATVMGNNTSIQNATRDELTQIGNQIASLAPEQAKDIAAVNTQIADLQTQYSMGMITAEQANIQQAQLMMYQNNSLKEAAYSAAVNAVNGYNSNIIGMQGNNIKASLGNAKNAIAAYSAQYKANNPGVKTVNNEDGSQSIVNNNGQVLYTIPKQGILGQIGNFFNGSNGPTYSPGPQTQQFGNPLSQWSY